MLKIGVLGVGHLGKIHVKCIRELPHYDLVGFYDPDVAKARAITEQYGLHCFESAEALLEAVDVVDIVTPTLTHFELAKAAIAKGKHLFIEKPLTDTRAQAVQLLELARQSPKLKIQVGHVERFNPAMQALENEEVDPMFIEAHRLAVFNPRGTDVSVVLDLMIHDLDIVLHLVKSPIRYISASGVAVVSDQPDICNARLEFENGCVANLTASRMSIKQMRKLRLFQRDAYISLDFMNKQAQLIRLHDSPQSEDSQMELHTSNGIKYLDISMPPVQAVNAIQLELQKLAESIVADQPTAIGLEDGYKALDVAHRILEEVNRRLRETSLS
ncbi:MAG: Gfo/Idh/MocA family oxidoreductase [Bacteroidota bacterium]